MGNWDVSKPDNDGERELLDRAVKALEAELATKTCNKQIASKLENAELARDSKETCNNKQVSCKLVASEDVVSLGVFEQVMWERDVAIDQLKELGYGFGEKPKTGHWIVLSATDMYCSECNEIEHLDTSRKFCSYCGTRMSENPTGLESEE